MQPLLSCAGSAEEDWLKDSGGHDMVYSKFYSSMFELADIWCDKIDGDEYVKFLKQMLDAVAVSKQ